MNMKNGILIVLCVAAILLLAIPINAQDNNVPEKISTLQYVCEKIMPWGAALLIGIASVIVTLLIGVISVVVNLRLIKSNEKNIQVQIKNARKITLAEFQATLGTKNRQEWINDLRNCISEFSMQCDILSTITTDGQTVSVDDAQKYGLYIDKIISNRYKINLLLNPKEPNQKKVLDKIDNLAAVAREKKDTNKNRQFIDAREKLLDASRELFQHHWDKIKKSLKDLTA